MRASAMLPPTLVRMPTYRLCIGLLLSLFGHLALMASIRPMTVEYASPTPLQVEIREAPAGPGAVVTERDPNDDRARALPLSALSEPARIERPPANTAGAAVSGLELNVDPNRYYRSREVDVRAEPINEVQLVYPQLAYQRRQQGRVTLRLLINERGGLDQVSVIEADPPGVFEEAALAAAEALRFSPARLRGRNVKSQKTVETTFNPYESINVP